MLSSNFVCFVLFIFVTLYGKVLLLYILAKGSFMYLHQTKYTNYLCGYYLLLAVLIYSSKPLEVSSYRYEKLLFLICSKEKY